MDELKHELSRRTNGEVYRIDFQFVGVDPRIALRADVDLTTEQADEICLRLRRFDSISKSGDWTLNLMSAIEAHPHTSAIELAGITGYEKDWLKRHVRKLKNLGLTISHHPGYEISPRGQVILRKLMHRNGDPLVISPSLPVKTSTPRSREGR